MHLAGQFLAREAGHQSLITVTRSEMSSDMNTFTLFISVFSDDRRKKGTRLLQTGTFGISSICHSKERTSTSLLRLILKLISEKRTASVSTKLTRE